ncbi:hypothetical protein AX14_003395 [Amanita brunnescens Koide BX004]|nr:hypothetical protein AX14_003395 [Amanita brunnescens Koide BX004]
MVTSSSTTTSTIDLHSHQNRFYASSWAASNVDANVNLVRPGPVLLPPECRCYYARCVAAPLSTALWQATLHCGVLNVSTGVFGWARTVGAVDKVDSGFAVSASRPLQLSATKPNLSLDISHARAATTCI